MTTKRTAPTAPGFNDTLAQTAAHAQVVGRDLSTAAITLAKDTARLAYDVGAVLAEAGRSLVGGTIRAAEGLARREGATDERPAVVPGRKPLATAGEAPTRRRRKRA